MTTPDDFSIYVADLLEGTYDCVDRIVLKGYFPYGQQGGGMRTWWRDLHGSDQGLCEEGLRRFAGDFSRRLQAYAKKNQIPLLRCAQQEQKPFELARQHRPTDPNFQGLFLILISRGPALVWKVKPCRSGAPHLEAQSPWPHVQHYQFHILDRQWGHLMIRMSGHPPFGIHVAVNGHEWVQRQALAQSVPFQKQDNCFVGGDFARLQTLAQGLHQPQSLVALAELADRWVYSTCLCFALDFDQQQRSHFRYEYSLAQLELSRNLLFSSAHQLDQLYQGLIDRTRRSLNVAKLKTIFGRKNRPHTKKGGQGRLERVLDQAAWDLTVFKLHFGRLTLKMYDKGQRVLRIEAIAYQITDLKCGKRLEKLLVMLEKLQQMLINFLQAVQAAHVSFLDDGALDALPQPSQQGSTRLAGVDIQKPRMRAVLAALLALAAQPDGFTSKTLAERVRQQQGPAQADYTARRAAYDLRKLRGKQLVERMVRTRRYRLAGASVRTVAALFIIREKVLKPLLAGAAKPKVGRPPKNIHPLDQHYMTLQRELSRTFETLGLAA